MNDRRYEDKKLVISFIIPTYKTPLPFLRLALDSVIAQTNPNWEICVGDDGSRDAALTSLLHDYAARDGRIKISISDHNAGISSASNRAASLATGAYLAFLDHDDVVVPDTVAVFSDALHLAPDADVLYSDEAKINQSGRIVGDYIKPGYSPDFLRSTMYVGHLFVIRRALFEELGGLRSDFDGSQDYDLALRACTPERIVVHVPYQLYLWRASSSSTALDMSAKPWAVQSARRAIDDFAARLPWSTHAEDGLLPATFRIRYAIKSKATVRIVIVCNSGTKQLPDGAQIPLLVNAVAYLRTATNGLDLEIAAVAETELEIGLFHWCAANDIRLYQSDKNDYRNLTELINAAVHDMESDIAVLMCDNIEILDPGWLVATVEFAQMPDIGAVGSRVSYMDGSVRHAGLVYTEQGRIERCFYRNPADVLEYQGFAHMIRNYSAVSRDCMTFSKRAWQRIGQFDEAFVSSLFDADFCFRATAAELRVVYTPFSHVRWLETAADDHLVLEQDRALFADRYCEFRDPFYSLQTVG